MKKVTALSQNQFTTKVSNNKHVIVSDEPKDIGGSDLGLRPTELLHASLASCSSITMRMYANRKEWDLGEIQVDVERIENDGEEPYLDKKIKIGGSMDDKQLERLKFIASKCPIHKLLLKAIDIRTEIN
ncbi:MAG: OsmC family protein [Bacteroidia bacterium]|nr:OsmC family protein [Bacteroidia bacterium]NNJ55534.1 OsmC family protein [Bacteroidia bacterium]